ncbi:unnamed protein product [Clonostachys byssicola]|uniref:FAD dependent oxidoreductase domain-containing protein n=1 Tax=Clonostachys byssicola TaxID=160290 RepID=A0A9N9U868_9HYPO|nr:unnamed protein product [Clonostachys byssicola]
MAQIEADVGVVGAGVMGLAASLLLVEAGYRVTVVAQHLAGDLTPNWTSPWAGALLAPHPDAGFPDIQETSLKRWHKLRRECRDAGVEEREIHEYYDNRKDLSSIWYKRIYPDLTAIPTEDLVFGAQIGFKYRGLIVDPNAFLPWLMRLLKEKGVKFIQRRISSLDELKSITGASILVNASGLGARELANDEKVHAVRGQTMFVPCDSRNMDRVTIHQGSHYTYAIPRIASGGVILGGVAQPDNHSRDIDPTTRDDIIRRVNELTRGQFSWVDPKGAIVKDIVGFRPARTGGIRVEREDRIIHAYGLGALGYVFAFGAAEKVVSLIQEVNRAKL